MDAIDRWRRIEEICHAALDRDMAARGAFVASACGDDAALRHEVEALLAHEHAAEAFLAEPAGALMRVALTREDVSMVGQRISQYRIDEKLGAGGMGVVYRAEDTKLKRAVALKFLSPDLTRDDDAKRRFMFEAQAASALEHTNICTIYDINETPDGQLFLAMAYYAGETLRNKIDRGPLPLTEALDDGIQIAEGLVKAHAADIVHRDIKPANVLVTDDGIVKIVDFGIAKLLGRSGATRTGATPGTIGYIAPEQLAGRPIDARSDIWSLGVVLYEMIAGRPPFGSDHPQPLTTLRRDVPVRLQRVVARALATDPDDRYQTTVELLSQLQGVKAALNRPPTALTRPIVKLALALAAVTGVIAVIAFGWFWQRSVRQQRALKMVPEISRLADTGNFAEAAGLTRQALAVLPRDAALTELWRRSTTATSVVTEPADADVDVQPYGSVQTAWERLGRTPLVDARVPRAAYVWRISKAGYAPITLVWGSGAVYQLGSHPGTIPTLRLRHVADVPPGMVSVPGGQITVSSLLLGALGVARVDDFLIDQYEVTNEQYQAFVDAGGYRRRDFWTQPLVLDGRTIAWDEALNRFRDSTGRPGPATWEAGTYPKGVARHPVAGISWYEAAAYAQFAGRALPTAFHWTRASQNTQPALAASGNFRASGSQDVGRPEALSGYGTSDMAGNVKEWCFNEGHDGKRFILGGGFGDPAYTFSDVDEQSPWERRANFGFRTMKLDAPASADALARIEPATRDFSREVAVSDDVFNAFRGLYAYDSTELHARVEEREVTDAWTREKVTFDAGYGHERVIAHVFLPKRVVPPFQAVVYFPGGYAMEDERLDMPTLEDSLDYVMKGGRALIAPIYKGTYERRDGLDQARPQALYRDQVIMMAKDLRRSVDYLDSRPDIDGKKVAYLGMSLGAQLAPIFLAVEPRIKAAILEAGGFPLRRDLPEIDRINFAPRVRTPVLMLNGRYDSGFPLESSQLPLFRMLGTPAADKKRVVYDAGHGNLPYREKIREALDWFDKYLGPVRRE